MNQPKIKYYYTILTIWTILVFFLIIFESYTIEKETENIAKVEAIANFNKDQAIRNWSASHGGVYVAVDSLTPPNPALSSIKERDVITPSGKKLTLMNPAYMIRQLNESFSKYYGIIGHITSKKLMRDKNEPDEWELNALNEFEKGVPEVSNYSEIDGKLYLRYMRPMYIKKGCMKCHAKQGYHLGDIRGGVSVAIPMAPIQARALKQKQRNISIYLFIWIVVIIGLRFGYRKLARSLHERKQAQLENQSKSVFIANMSHELRSPLNAIIGFTNLLRKELNTDPSQIEKIDIIQKSSENLLNLINNILDISKIEAGHMVLEEDNIDLRLLLNEVVELMSVRMKEKGLKYSINVSHDVPVVIRLDGAKLRQIVLNLLTNAIKFTDYGEIIIEVKVKSFEIDNRILLVISIIDTGIGISQDNQNVIFSPFEQRGDQPSDESGTGLGLAICKQYIELMGGQINVKSTLGKGSTFSIQFPATKINTIIKDKPLMKSNSVIGVLPGQPMFRILIAEDQIANRKLLKSLLAPLNLEVREATNGEEAVEIALKWKPHLIWMDIRMPVMDGLEATKIIKRKNDNKNIKIIALTAHALEEERLEIINAGCDLVIRKPYREDDIYKTLSDQLGLKFRYTDSEKIEIINGLESSLVDQLKRLTPELLSELKEATIILEREAIIATVNKIKKYNHNLSHELLTLVNELNYKKIITYIRKAEEQ